MSHLRRGSGGDKESRFADLFSRLGKEEGPEVRWPASVKAAGRGVGDPGLSAGNVPFAKGSEEECDFFTAGEVRTKLLTYVGAEVNWHHSWTD